MEVPRSCATSAPGTGPAEAGRSRHCRLNVSMSAPGTAIATMPPSCGAVTSTTAGDREAAEWCAPPWSPSPSPGWRGATGGGVGAHPPLTVCGTVHLNRTAGDDSPLLLVRIAVRPLADRCSPSTSSAGSDHDLQTSRQRASVHPSARAFSVVVSHLFTWTSGGGRTDGRRRRAGPAASPADGQPGPAEGSGGATGEEGQRRRHRGGAPQRPGGYPQGSVPHLAGVRPRGTTTTATRPGYEARRPWVRPRIPPRIPLPAAAYGGSTAHRPARRHSHQSGKDGLPAQGRHRSRRAHRHRHQRGDRRWLGRRRRRHRHRDDPGDRHPVGTTAPTGATYGDDDGTRHHSTTRAPTAATRSTPR